MTGLLQDFWRALELGGICLIGGFGFAAGVLFAVRAFGPLSIGVKWPRIDVVTYRHDD